MEAIDSEIAPKLQPEVVIIDIGMPEMDGCEGARRLRKQPDTSKVTLIALSGYGQESARQRARSAGFDEYLVKPVDIEELLDILRR